jgi:hypothetical protein
LTNHFSPIPPRASLAVATQSFDPPEYGLPRALVSLGLDVLVPATEDLRDLPLAESAGEPDPDFRERDPGAVFNALASSVVGAVGIEAGETASRPTRSGRNRETRSTIGHESGEVAQYHLPRTNPPNAISPMSVTISPIQKLQKTIGGSREPRRSRPPASCFLPLGSWCGLLLGGGRSRHD